MAEAGEFSLRALANGRMDLSEAEAVRDLIDAQTTASARLALRQLRGAFSHRLQPLKDGPLLVVAKPPGPASPGFEADSRQLLRTVKAYRAADKGIFDPPMMLIAQDVKVPGEIVGAGDTLIVEHHRTEREAARIERGTGGHGRGVSHGDRLQW